MEQNIKPQQPTYFHNKNKVIVAVIIIVAVIAIGIYFWTIKNFSKDNNERQNTQTQNQLSPFPNNDTAPTGINPKDYSLVASSASGLSFKNTSGDLLKCNDEGFLPDRRLVKSGEVIIPSLIYFIHNYEEERQDKKSWNYCGMAVNEFLIPASGRYLYLHVRYSTFNESLASDFYIYRLDLSNLSIKRLFSGISDANHKFRDGEYKLLSDEKRAIQWNSSGVYLVDLEKDAISNLYEVSQDQWLISRAEETEVMTVDKYDIEVNENQITIGVYDKNKFQEDKTESGYSVKNYALVNRITVSIPFN